MNGLYIREYQRERWWRPRAYKLIFYIADEVVDMERAVGVVPAIRLGLAMRCKRDLYRMETYL